MHECGKTNRAYFSDPGHFSIQIQTGISWWVKDRFAKCEMRMEKVSAHDFRSDVEWCNQSSGDDLFDIDRSGWDTSAGVTGVKCIEVYHDIQSWKTKNSVFLYFVKTSFYLFHAEYESRLYVCITFARWQSCKIYTRLYWPAMKTDSTTRKTYASQHMQIRSNNSPKQWKSQSSQSRDSRRTARRPSADCEITFFDVSSKMAKFWKKVAERSRDSRGRSCDRRPTVKHY